MKVISRFRLVLSACTVLVAALSLTGCLSMIMEAGMAKAIAPNYIPFHANAQIGDYALWSTYTRSRAIINPDSRSIVRYEISGKEKDLFVVSIRTERSSVKSVENFGFEYWVDKNGFVQKAFWFKVNGKPVKKNPMNIAQKNESGSVEYTDLNIPAHLRNATQTFPEAKLFRADSYTREGLNDLTTVNYYVLQDTIPFKILYGRALMEMNMVTSSYSETGNLRTTMYVQETETMTSIIKLIESGNTAARISEKYDENYELTE